MRPGGHIDQVAALFHPKRDVLGPEGLAGNYMPQDAPYGPAFWEEIFHEVLRQRLDPFNQWLEQVQSMLIGSGSKEQLFDNESANKLVTDLAAYASVLHSWASVLNQPTFSAAPGLAEAVREATRSRSDLQAKETSFFANLQKLVDGMPANNAAGGGAGASGPPGRSAENYGKTLENMRKDLEDLKKLWERPSKRGAPPMNVASLEAALHWLVSNVEHPNATELAAIKDMFPQDATPVINWVTDPYVGRMRLLNADATGTINQLCGELSLTCKRAVEPDEIISHYSTQSARAVAMRLNAKRGPTRFAGDQERDRLDRRSEVAQEVLRAVMVDEKVVTMGEAANDLARQQLRS